MRLRVLAVVAAVVLAGCPPDEPCPTGETRCDGVCLDLQASPLSCGACGILCATGATCEAGACRCPTGQAVCDGACVDTATDEANCGDCGQDCGAGGTCAGGACSCEGTLTSTPCAVAAWPYCRDLTADEAHCGACGAACQKPGSQCTPAGGGTCACAEPRPQDCTTYCADVDGADAQNCGGCGLACTLPGKTRCAGGACACVTGLSDCGTAGCFDLQADEAHCGTCTTQCSSGVTCCAGGCADTKTSKANCGACGNACGGDLVCVASACGCADGKKACGTTCCAGTQCCGDGTACQPAHQNGLGGTYLLGCSPVFATGPATTHEAALAAALSWSSAGTTRDPATGGAVLCDPYCVARETGTECAIWCYGASNSPGRVKKITGTCSSAACPWEANSPTWN